MEKTFYQLLKKIKISFFQDGGEANVFHFWELYESNTAMGRHNTVPEVEGFMQKVQPLLEGPIGMALYEMKNGKLGQASVQGGPRGEGGLDDATGATGAAGGASYKQTSGTIDLSTFYKIFNFFFRLENYCFFINPWCFSSFFIFCSECGG